MGFSLELYKTKINDEALNNAILKLVNVLEENKQKYVDSFPIEPVLITLKRNIKFQMKILKM